APKRSGRSMQKEEKVTRFTENATWVSTSSATSSSTTSRSIWNFKISWSFWIITSAATISSTSIHQPRRPYVSSTPEDLHMDDDMAPDAQAHSFDDEYIGNAYIPK
nr:hypothetical protein [Tanacetum cinerariifolium]